VGGSPGGAGDSPGGAGRKGLRHGRLAWRRGRQGPAARTVRLAARRQGLTPGLPTIMVDPAAVAVDGGNANGGVHVAHAVAGEGPAVDRSTDPEMYVSLSLAARTTRTWTL